LILNGRFSGHKAVIIKNIDNQSSNDSKKIVLLGIKQYPKKITRKMPKSKIHKRSRIKTFVKTMNKNHVFPTRYILDLDKKNKEVIEQKTEEIFNKKKMEKGKGSTVIETAKLFFLLDNILMEKFFAGKTKWFFNRLRF